MGRFLWVFVVTAVLAGCGLAKQAQIREEAQAAQKAEDAQIR
jgi:hypothetical protein